MNVASFDRPMGWRDSLCLRRFCLVCGPAGICLSTPCTPGRADVPAHHAAELLGAEPSFQVLVGAHVI